MTWIENHLGEWVVRHRWGIILLTVPTILVCAAGITRIRISNDTRVFFGADNPDYQKLKALEHTYSREQTVDFLVAPRDGNIFTRETLTAYADELEPLAQGDEPEAAIRQARALLPAVQDGDQSGEDCFALLQKVDRLVR